MFSVSFLNQRWKLAEGDERLALALSQRHSVSATVAQLMAARGITLDDAEDFLHPSLKNLLPDPSLLKDMDAASARIARAITAQERVCVFGDYDVDGATSSALLVRYFRSLGRPLSYYIPDRAKEGYGPSVEAMQKLAAANTQLLITVDCGTAAHEALGAAKDAGMDVVVLDHHLGSEQNPPATAIINPNRLDETFPYRHLAAVGVTFLTLVAVNKQLREQEFFSSVREPSLLQLLDLVALGTVCDVVSLKGINRAFVTQGLKVMGMRQNIGLAALADVAGMEDAPTAYHAGFVLGPRINAGGRIGKSDLGTRLLSTEDPGEARELAQELNELNKERQALEQIATEQAMQMAEVQARDHAVIIVADERWHQGIIGITAGRIKEAFNRPVVVMALEKGMAKGSARSVPGADIGGAVVAARQMGIVTAGGGHAMAAGMSMDATRLDELRVFLNERLGTTVRDYMSGHTLRIDAAVGAGGLNLPLAKSMELLAPFGAGNAEPRLAVLHARIHKITRMGTNHLSCFIADGGMGAGTREGDDENKRAPMVRAVAFKHADSELGDALLRAQGKTVHLAGKLRINRWQGMERPEFQIEDAAPDA